MIANEDTDDEGFVCFKRRGGAAAGAQRAGRRARAREARALLFLCTSSLDSILDKMALFTRLHPLLDNTFN